MGYGREDEHVIIRTDYPELAGRFKEQTDFVKTLLRYAKFDKMQIKKVTANNSIRVSVYNDTRHITFEFIKYDPPNDDYVAQGFVYTGAYTPVIQSYEDRYWTDLTRTGTWVNATEAVNGYTSVVGSTWEATVNVLNDGDSIQFVANANNRGGVWKITIDGSDRFVNVSTYADPSSKVTVEIASNMKKGLYKVKGEFMGDDPLHPPATSPSYGWLRGLNLPVVQTGERFANVSLDTTLNPPSNKDFAFNIAPAGGTNYNFVPQHSGVATAFYAEPAAYKDGEKTIDVSSMGLNTYKRVNSFALYQHVFGRNPDSGINNLIEVWSSQSITKDGLYQVDGKMKVLQPIKINTSYTIMGVVQANLFDKLISSMGNQYDLPTTAGTSTKLIERDWGKSYVFVSSGTKDLAIAIRYNNINDTLRQDQSNKGTPADFAFLKRLDANQAKLYNRLWDAADLPAEYVMRFSGDFLYANVPFVYDLLCN